MTSIPCTQPFDEYAQLADDFLKILPANNPEDLTRISEALKGILNDSEALALPDPLKGSVESIRDLLDPAMGYCQPEHYDRFKTIIMEKIAAKVNEIILMTQADKDLYVEKQREQREPVSEQHKKMSTETAPAEREERHTCSEFEMMKHISRTFRDENHPFSLPSNKTPDEPDLNPPSLPENPNRDLDKDPPPTNAQNIAEGAAGQNRPINTNRPPRLVEMPDQALLILPGDEEPSSDNPLSIDHQGTSSSTERFVPYSILMQRRGHIFPNAEEAARFLSLQFRR